MLTYLNEMNYIGNAMLYPDLYKTLEKARWNLHDGIPWGDFNPGMLTDEQALTIKYNAMTEWSALPATEMFLRDNNDDSDFSAFISIWFYEEQKHALALLEYLQRFRPDLVPSEAELDAIRFKFDAAPPLETLMLHFCGEVRLTHWYKRAAEWHNEPVIKCLYGKLASDEARHASCYMRYMKKAIANLGAEARLAFAKIGVLMTNTKTSAALHPTNLHVNKDLFPHDTIQSKLPDPQWLEYWLDQQIRFDGDWENKVILAILRKLSSLFDVPLMAAKDLRTYRKSLLAA